MRIAHIKIALFLLFLAAPVASIPLLGSVGAFGREQPDFPRLAEMLRGQARNQFGDAVLERSAAMKYAVKLHDWIGYRVVGFVSTSVAISGKDGWLFYRPEFHDGACMDLDHVAVQLRRLRALTGIARASGLDLRVSLSPNKSTIYPDSLNPYFRGYWRCLSENAAGLRRLLKQDAPFLIDHAEVLLAERTRNPDTPLYYTADTHWTPYGGAIALRQLLMAIYPGLEIPPPRLSGATITQRMDLASSLQLSMEEQAGEVAHLPQDILDQLSHESAVARTLITHDSFYARISSQLQEAFPNAVVIRGTRDRAWMQAEIAATDRLIVNFVERGLVRAITEGSLNWRASIPSAIVARNQRLAEQCRSFATVDAMAAESSAQGGKDVDAIIAVRDVEQQHLPCLRMSLSASAPTVITIALPNAASGAFEAGSLIRFQLEAGRRTVGFVLPDYVVGGHVGLRVDGLGKTATMSSIEIGEIPLPRLASPASSAAKGSARP